MLDRITQKCQKVRKKIYCSAIQKRLRQKKRKNEGKPEQFSQATHKNVTLVSSPGKKNQKKKHQIHIDIYVHRCVFVVGRQKLIDATGRELLLLVCDGPDGPDIYIYTSIRYIRYIMVCSQAAISPVRTSIYAYIFFVNF